MFENAGCGHEFMCAMAEQEITKTTDKNLLFRANNASSKAFKFYSRMVGLPYLFKSLARPIYDLHKSIEEENLVALEIEKSHHNAAPSSSSQPPAIDGGQTSLTQSLRRVPSTSTLFVSSSVEVNPEKLQEGADVNLNIVELQIKCQKFLLMISQSEHNLPRQLIEVMRAIKILMEKHFPDAVEIAFGNFLFLRFLVPSLVSPEAFGLVKGKKKEDASRRKCGSN
jgi:hypothetical protein